MMARRSTATSAVQTHEILDLFHHEIRFIGLGKKRASSGSSLFFSRMCPELMINKMLGHRS